MTDPDDDHEFSEGQGFSDAYDAFDLEPPELEVDAGAVDPVDSRVVPDLLDERAFPDDEVDAESLLDVGLNYMGINRHEQATETFDRAAQFADDDRIAQEAWINKGAAHGELEEYDEAVGAYREALRIDDENDHAASAETNLAYALWESGQTAQALEHSERAVELDPRFGQAWYNRGFFLLERGLAEDALNCFDNATRLGERSAHVLEEKARALEEVGEMDRAQEVMEEAEELRERRQEEMLDEGR
jgi:tetratricopeptide (TPR) repeat protein